MKARELTMFCILGALDYYFAEYEPRYAAHDEPDYESGIIRVLFRDSMGGEHEVMFKMGTVKFPQFAWVILGVQKKDGTVLSVPTA